MKKQIISAICAVTMLASVSAGFATVSAETTTEYVLTNNLITDFDKSLYPGMECINLGLTYDCNDDAFDGGSTDPDKTKFTSGDISGGDFRWGSWTGPSAVIVADAKYDNVYITGVDLYSWEKDAYCGVNELKASVSSDNENYSEPVTVGYDSRTLVYDKPDDDTDLYKHTINFTQPVNGRYIKIEASRYYYQQLIAEFVVRGYYNDTDSKILTKNTDDTNYPGMSNLDIGLTYTITSVDRGPYPEVLKNDPDFTKLTNGVKNKNGGGEYAVWGGWQSDNKVEIIADAHTNVYITGADLFAYNAQNGAISYSTDGVNYTSLGTVAQTPGDGADKFSASCGRVMARYIKFEIERGSEANIVLAEIVVKGYPAAFSFGGTKFDSATNTFSGVLMNKPNVNSVASMVITALYDETGRLVDAKVEDVTVDANSSQAFSADFSGVIIGNGYSINSYAWDNNLKPFTAPAGYIYTAVTE